MKAVFKGRIFTIPNLLSFSRILMIPWFVHVYLFGDNSSEAALILLLSGLTDTADGIIARRFDMVSNLGKALDPLADKLTQIAVAACLFYTFPHMWLLLTALCVKELFVMITSVIAIYRCGEVLPADWHGKITTVAVYGVMILHLLFPGMQSELSVGLIALCIGMIILSGVLYGIRNFRAMQIRGERESCA
ncbi:MAG: CDP-alcohol phosphatidyltransferase family protein [Oscillospiraceae bacterium]|nr:CDP-alcohol phosphatidyltransferase family protein [Oscillospiraceae bacterium]